MVEDWEAIITGRDGTVNRHLGTRFDTEGRFMAEHGNTVVCQVIPGSPTEDALRGLRAGLMALPGAGHFAFTDVESYHMTLFEGVIETRREVGIWPEDLPLSASIDRMTEAMADKLAGFVAPPAFGIKPVGLTPFGLQLAGATAEDEALARAWRDGLAGALGLLTPGHAAYGFHTTLAYVHDWVPEALLPAYRTGLAGLCAAFVARVRVMDLARPAFCRFSDMNAFPPVLGL